MSRPITLVMTEPTASDALLAQFSKLGGYSGLRVCQDLWLSTIHLDRRTVRDQMAGYEGRIGIGAEEIWANFPEYRKEFVAKVTRATPNGVVVIDRPLKYVIAGDLRVGQTLELQSSPSFDPIRSISTDHEAVSVSTSELSLFAFIDKPVTSALPFG